MKKFNKSTGLTVALLIYVSATAAYFLPPQYGNQQYGEIYNRNCFVCHCTCVVAGAS